MKKYDVGLIGTAVAAIGLYFFDKCQILFLSLLLRLVIFQLSISTYVLSSLSVATGKQQVYTSFSYQLQTQLTDDNKCYRCNTVSFF